MHLVRAPFLLRFLFPETTWIRSRKEKKIYLTFDDGPVPEVTPWVLDTLQSFDVKATFFCVGENVVKYPDIFSRIREEQHGVGNHTFNHLKGWNTDTTTYVKNVRKCNLYTQSTLFRPPYGKVSKAQLNMLKQEYEIIMWDVLTGDYSRDISPAKCLENCLRYTRNGSIIVFHDHIKALKNVQYALPRAIEQLHQKGFTFELL